MKTKLLFISMTLSIAAGTGFANDSNLAADSNSYNRIGGWKEINQEPKRFFYTQEIDGVWWLIDPGGNGFISKGVNHISYTADFSPKLGFSPYARATEEKYGNAENWGKAVAANLRQWNFNTVGSWSIETMRQQQIPYTLILDVAQSAGGDWQTGRFPDVFSKEFERAAERAARMQCRKRENDPFLIGYFTDNELHWEPDWRSQDSLLTGFLKMKSDTPGFKAAVDFLQKRYGSIGKLNAALKTEVASFAKLPDSLPFPESGERATLDADFQYIASEKYFSVCRDAIRKEDPNHLIVGCRFAGNAPEAVLRAAGKHCEIISFNTYNYAPPQDALKRIYDLTGKPILITEFSFKAMDSGLPNTKGAGKPVATQTDRAGHFTAFVTALMKRPYLVGYHWFEYADEPAEGRFDGENSNYGLVNIKDEPYEVLTQEMTKTNAAVEEIHVRLVINDNTR